MPRNAIDRFQQQLLQADACDAHPPLARSTSPEEAALWWETVQHCADVNRDEHLRWLALNDLFFLLVYILNRRHLNGEEKGKSQDTRKAKWCFERAWEVQNDPNGFADIWSREHAKTEIITFGLNIQTILKDPEVTIGLFSHNRPLAKKFLRLIKHEFENNELLRDLFPDVLYRYPDRESQKWGEEGITVKRQGNLKECTVEAWGVVDGQPVASRFKILHYDDVIGRDEVTSPEVIANTSQEFDHSLFLTASDPPVIRYVGTPQEVGDTTQHVIDKKIVKERKRVGIAPDGSPLFWSEEKLAFFRNSLTPKVFALEVLLDPTKAQDEAQIGFKLEWLKGCRYRECSPLSLYRYVIVDPAGAKKDSNSFYAAWVVGAGADRKFRVLDGVRDKFNLSERTDVLFYLVGKWQMGQPDWPKVLYEEYAMQADIEHIQLEMDKRNFRFTITPVGGNQLKKDERIELLIPPFRGGEILFPEVGIPYMSKTSGPMELVQFFIDEEYSKFPFGGGTKDMLDDLARIKDPKAGICFPRPYGATEEQGWGGSIEGDGGSWMVG